MNEVTTNLQADLNAFAGWCIRNKLTVNVAKTKYMSFSHKPRNCQLTLNDVRLLRVPTYTYLGVILDPKLNYQKFINHQVNNVNYRAYQLAQLARFLGTGFLIIIYKTYVLPVIEYGDILISNANVDLLTKLERCQSKCLKIALKVPIRTPTEDVLCQTRSNSIRDRRRSHMLIAAYQRSRQVKYVDQRNLRTRGWDGPMLKMSFSKLTMYQHSLEYTLATLWNNSKAEDRLIPSLELFKATMKQRLIDRLPKPPD